MSAWVVAALSVLGSSASDSARTNASAAIQEAIGISVSCPLETAESLSGHSGRVADRLIAEGVLRCVVRDASLQISQSGGDAVIVDDSRRVVSIGRGRFGDAFGVNASGASFILAQFN